MTKAADEATPQPSELYDFLYRDFERIASYYAQIWNGRLLAVEETATDSERSEETIGGSVQVASTESKLISEAQFQQKRNVDMHDAATVDLLIRLAAQRAEKKGFGSIYVLSGTCFFLDRNMLKYAGPAIDASMPEHHKRNTDSTKQARERAAARELAASIKQLVGVMEMPSGFVLKVNDEVLVCGPIKESGLDQPISSLLFRAGGMGLANTFVVGMTEELAFHDFSSISPMARAQCTLASSFLSLLFPANALRMVPLAIYRKIPI